jgi:hypothetical protein
MNSFFIALLSQPVSVGFLICAVLIVGAAVGLINALMKRTPKEPAPALEATECTPAQKFRSWAKRHTPLIGFVGSLLGLLFIYHWLLPLIYSLNGVEQPLPGQENADGAQVLAGQQAGGVKQLGAIVSIFLGGTFFFSGELFGVWSLMGFITPGIPVWAKKFFTPGFINPGEDGFDMTTALPTVWKFVVYLVVWLSLLFIWTINILAAALSQ